MSMIDSIKGSLVLKDPTFAILDVGGIRFRIHISISTFESLGSKGTTVDLLTYLHVREDILDLYGFGSESERSLYMNLLTITGIGPRSAMNILSGTNPAEFKQRIIAGDVESLTVIPGIGLKTAKRIIVELKEKFVDFATEDTGLEFLSSETRDLVNDVTRALLSLGYKQGQVYRALKELEKDGDLSGGLESIIKKALTRLT